MEKKHEKLVLFYDSIILAEKDSKNIEDLSNKTETLYVIIRDDYTKDIQTIASISPNIQVYTGRAWSKIHEHRLNENWYDTEA